MPGCKVDTALILEGNQGVGKSSALKVLADPWFTDDMADLGTKDAAMQTAGVWLVEMGELSAMARSEVERVKAFLSRRVDRFRRPYERRTVEVPRQCVFSGSTNGDDYLRDETGARRFWPVKTGRLNLDTLARERDQLWGEAMQLYRQGAPWWLDEASLIAEAQAAQAARYAGDAWDDVVSEYVGSRDETSVADVLAHGLAIERSRWGQVEQNRVARILRTLGFERKQVRSGADRAWKYVRNQ